MIKFYDVDKNYINFLKTIDSQIPNIEYEGNNKFVCGIVLTINNINYYAPISHMTNRQRTNIQITENGRVLSTIRFSFMFPAMENVLTVKDFSVIAQNNQQYADLLSAEYRFCRTHEAEIYNKALQVYKIGYILKIKEKKMKKNTFAMVAGGVVALMAMLAFAMVAAIR